MKITQTPIWQTLVEHHYVNQLFDMRQAFRQEPQRFERFSLQAAGLMLDYSKNRMSEQTLELLIALAHEAVLPERISRMFQGEAINTTEQRPVLHVAMRNRSHIPIQVAGQDVMPQICAVLEQMENFSHAVRKGIYKGASGKAFTDVVNISIGGSHLGPEMVTAALAQYQGPLRCHFVSNIDGTDIVTVLRHLNAETTLFIIGSKSFSTLETLTNANTAKAWLVEQLGEQAVKTHFVAATTSSEKARAFGVDDARIFLFWPWVGGRFSVWSSIGLVIALAAGMENFIELLSGAHAMDQHFRAAPFERNMPVLLALLGIWYQNFYKAESYAVVCYDHYLRYFPRYLQQVEMESNGKSVDQQGEAVTMATGPITFGDCGTNSQHSFHQLFHQGTHLIPIDFILPLKSLNPIGHHHELLVSNCLAQSAALLHGKDEAQCLEELMTQGIAPLQARMLASHKAMPGNRPSNTLLFEKLTPRVLGALMALYELKIFVQGSVLGINSFDQWGVELGKELTRTILPSLSANPSDLTHYDSSTAGLIRCYQASQQT